jgi:tRNA/tmRNA/rRNA uracil-C5-methylase (TrmA/RlmC/RlmD family)
VARWEGLVVFVSGGLPGESVQALVTQRQSRCWFARTLEVLEASPDRVDHVWPLAGTSGVGGADLGHVRLEAQRDWKAAVITGQLRRIGHLDAAVTVEAAPGDQARGGLAWRSRVEFTADQRGRLAMYAPWSDRLVPIDSMPLAHEDIQAAQPWAETYRPHSRMAWVRSSGRPDQGPRLTAVELASGTPGPGVVWEHVELASRDDLVYRVDPTGFWQVHRLAPAVLVQAALSELGDLSGATVLDLYCGAGLFTLPLAQAVGSSGRVQAIEGDTVAAANARLNCADWPQARVWAGPVAKLLSRPAAGGPGSVQAVLLDPPRRGAGRAVIDQLVGLGPDRIVYLACDPAALARDLAWLHQAGYRLDHLRAFDLFPMTHHVEAMATLVRA